MMWKDGGDNDDRDYNRRQKSREETPLNSLNIAFTLRTVC